MKEKKMIKMKKKLVWYRYKTVKYSAKSFFEQISYSGVHHCKEHTVLISIAVYALFSPLFGWEGASGILQVMGLGTHASYRSTYPWYYPDWNGCKVISCVLYFFCLAFLFLLMTTFSIGFFLTFYILQLYWHYQALLSVPWLSFNFDSPNICAFSIDA